MKENKNGGRTNVSNGISGFHETEKSESTVSLGDYRADMYDIVAQRHEEGKPSWEQNVPIRDILHSDTTLPEKRDAVVEAVTQSQWYKKKIADNPYCELESIITELEDVEEVEHFDLCLGSLYDEADYDRVWLG